MAFEPGSSEPVDILIVDDAPENLLALEGILSTPDYNLVRAQSGGEALKLVLKHEFAVILLDVVMAGLDGFETARLVRTREKSKHIPILFLTAHGAELSLIYEGYSVGAVDYLIKPIDPQVVKAKVAVFVDLFRKTRQIERQQHQLREAERLRAELALRESVQEYDVTFEQAALGIVHAGLNGRILKVNQHFTELSGYSKQEALALGFRDLLHPEERVAAWQALQELHERFAAQYSQELRLVKKDGTTAWVSITASVTRAETGAAKRYIVTAEDVTERRRAEKRQSFLAAASERLLSSLDYKTTLSAVAAIAVPELADWCAVDVVQEDGDMGELALAHVDPQKIPLARELQKRLKSDPQWALAKVMKTGCPEAVTNDGDLSQHATEADTRELLAQVGFASSMVVPLVARGRTLGALTFVCAPGKSGYGALDLAMATDLAQRAALAIDNAGLYQKAQEAIRMREEFLSVASHELRTPLGPLLMQIQSLVLQLEQSSGKVDSERLRHNLDRAERQVDRLRALVETLLDVSRLANRDFSLTLDQVNLTEVLREATSAFAEQSARAESALTLEAAENVVGRWDRLRLEQVVTNLLANAIKYGAGKPISVTLESTAGSARISVRDQGIGIPPDKLSDIFKRYERAVPTDSYGGLGLGLYVARQIAEAHGGTISVTSEVGRGSTFVLELPLVAKTARTEKRGGAQLRSA